MELYTSTSFISNNKEHTEHHCVTVKHKLVLYLNLLNFTIQSCWQYVTQGDLIDEMTPQQRQAPSWLNKPRETVMAKIIGTMEEVTYVFKSSCWQYVTLGDLIDEMTPEQRQAHSWLNKPKETVTAKIIWTIEEVTHVFKSSCWQYITLGDLLTR